MYKDGVLDVICMVYAYFVWILNDAHIEIGEFSNFLVDHREVFVDASKEVFEDVDYGLFAHEVICEASNYWNVIFGFVLKGVDSMVYDMIDES